MVFLTELGKNSPRHAIQIRRDFFDQVGTQVHHLVDEGRERFDARKASIALGAFLRYGVERVQLRVANGDQQFLRQHEPER